ncbi:uncharacterized protein LOC115088836 [Rhinatrema bivittatum]|uniref:uncharacterized protein LOC115088836 n=1 Tax=Rhinatrema bivittatum TaxID=194408 RepID=UPI00112D2149|nr:uncharacterized protein LOC115088836 [Rhinatrema bivittatum]
MAELWKRRSMSPLMTVDAYIQNKREDEDLCVRLDSMHHRHWVTLNTLRQKTNHMEKQHQHLLLQRAISQRSTLGQVMNEIRSLKSAKLSSDNKRDLLPDIELSIKSDSALPKPNHLQMFLWQPSVSFAPHGKTQAKDIRSLVHRPLMQRASSAMELSRFRSDLASVKTPERTMDFVVEQPKAMLSLQRRSASTVEVMTYRQLGGIAKIENIYIKETEMQKKNKLLEKEQIKQKLNASLQEKIKNFLKNCEKD